ncbi:MAG: hypothetical protein ACI9O1_000694 [Candidatus Thalassarchaeaceae archaeon]
MIIVPVRKANLENSSVSPFRRLSASQVIAWRNCPRLWYYGWRERLKSPLPPQIIRGNAVEECICRVLRDSPLYLLPDSDYDMTSPILEDGSPALDQQEGWIGPKLEILPESNWPKNRYDFENWAKKRAIHYFDDCWERATNDWKNNPNRKGNSSDIESQEGLDMVISGLNLHFNELERCIVQNGGINFENWRITQNRGLWPSPDGFPRNRLCDNPSITEGQMTWIEAWEFARPWFVDPDAKSFSQTSSHPEEWFQGEYDLVYRWSGKINIIDLKASIGKGDRSAGYLEQLRLYAWLWWESHDRLDIVSELEIWYLGTGTSKKVPVPDVKEMELLSIELKDLYELIHAHDPDISDCPTNPTPLNIFEKGGNPASPSIDQDPLSRCKVCDVRAICDGSDYEIELPMMDRIERFGHAWPVTPLGNLKTRFTVSGEVLHLNGPELSSNGAIDLSFTLQNGYDRAKVKTHRNGGPKKVSRSINEGSWVRIDNSLASLWKGQLVLDLDNLSRVNTIEKSSNDAIVEVETRASIVGRVWSIDAFPDGKGIRRWSITIVDNSGSGGAVAFKQFIPNSAAAIERGDEIAILNGESGEFAGRSQIRIGPGTRVVILKNSEDLIPF